MKDACAGGQREEEEEEEEGGAASAIAADGPLPGMFITAGKPMNDNTVSAHKLLDKVWAFRWRFCVTTGNHFAV